MVGVLQGNATDGMLFCQFNSSLHGGIGIKVPYTTLSIPSLKSPERIAHLGMGVHIDTLFINTLYQ
jgi:hypothetical protein